MACHQPLDFATVRRMALALAGVEESLTYGKPSFKLRGDLLACIPSHRSAEPDSLVVRVDFDQRAELVAHAPEVYYSTDHYADYPAVLVRLSKIPADALPGLLGMAYSFVQAKQRKRKSPRGA